MAHIAVKHRVSGAKRKSRLDALAIVGYPEATYQEVR